MTDHSVETMCSSHGTCFCIDMVCRSSLKSDVPLGIHPENDCDLHQCIPNVCVSHWSFSCDSDVVACECEKKMCRHFVQEMTWISQSWCNSNWCVMLATHGALLLSAFDIFVGPHLKNENCRLSWRQICLQQMSKWHEFLLLQSAVLVQVQCVKPTAVHRIYCHKRKHVHWRRLMWNDSN